MFLRYLWVLKVLTIRMSKIFLNIWNNLILQKKVSGVDKVVNFKDFSRWLVKFKTFSRLYTYEPLWQTKMKVISNQGKMEQDWLIQRNLQLDQNISIAFWLNFCYFLLMLNQKGKFWKMEW